MYSHHIVRLFYLSILCLIISACSGGGGSVEPEDRFSLDYTGLSDQVNLNRSNSLDMLETVYDLALPAFYLSSIGTYAITPYFLEVDPDSIDTELCENEGLSVDDRRNPLSSEGTIVFHFFDCESDGSTLNGKLIYELYDVTEFFYKINVSIEKLSVSSPEETIILDGRTRYNETDQGFIISGDLQARSNEKQLDFQISNLEITGTSLVADVFNGDYGFASISIDAITDKLLMSGSSGTSLKGDLTKVSTSYPAFIQSFDLQLNDGIDRPFPLRTNIDIETLLVRSDINNRQILRIESNNYSVDRLDALSIDAAIQDPDGDFIEYSWGSLTSPETCTSSLVRNTATTVDFTSNCQGAHSVSLYANDGFNPQVEYALNINVVPLPAEIQIINDEVIMTGDQLSIPVNVTNLQEDGPFNFSFAYAPKGVSINDQGLITGKPTAFVKENESNFRIGVTVDNGRATNTHFNVKVNGGEEDQSLISTSEICISNNKNWMDIDGDGLPEMACPFFHSYRLFELDGGVINVSYVELDQLSEEKLHSVIHYDIDADGLAEILLAYDSEIILIDGVTKEVIKKIPFSPEVNELYSFSYQLLLPSTLNNIFVYVRNYDFQYHLLNLDGQNIVAPMLNGPAIDFMVGYKNIDQDPEPEIFSEDRVFHFGGEIAHLNTPINKVEDLDGDDVKDLLRITEPGLLDDQNWGIFHYDDQLNLLNQYTISRPDVIGGFYWTEELELVNLDADPEKEIIERNGFLVFDLQAENYEFALQMQDAYSSNLARTFFTQLDGNSILLPGRYFAATLSFGNYTALNYANPLYDRDLSKPVVKPDGSISFYFSNIDGQTSLGFVDIGADGKLNNTEILREVNAPYYAYSVIGTSYTSPDKNEVLTHGSNTGFQIFDLTSFAQTYQSTFEASATPNTELVEADFDSNGRPDYFSFVRQSGYSNPMITWFDPDQDVENWSYSDSENKFYLGAGLSKVLSFDGGLSQRLVSLFSARSISNEFDYVLKVFSYDAGNINEISSIGINEPNLLDGITMGFQDIDNDGKPEIIISKFEQFCDHDRGSEIELFDDDFTYLRTIQVSECVSVIPDIDSNEPKSNIIASSAVGNLSLKNNSALKAYSRFLEIGAITGDKIWESGKFIGQLDEDTFVSLGNDPYLSKKIGVFDSGIYVFD
jgi:hypothetical protein